MEGRGLTKFCLETLAREVRLEKVRGLDDLEQIKLLSGEDGGGSGRGLGEGAAHPDELASSTSASTVKADTTGA